MFQVPSLRTDDEQIDFLTKLKSRAGFVMATAQAARPAQSVMDKCISNLTKPKDERDAQRKEYGALVTAARAGDATALAAVARIRVKKVMAFLQSMSNWAMFFDRVPLADDEAPYWSNTFQREVFVSASGADGKPRRHQAQRDIRFTQIQPTLVSSAIVEYTLRDLVYGNIADETRAMVNIAADLAFKIDQMAKPFVTGSIGNFTVTGDKLARTYVPHSGVQTDNLPTTNAITETTDARFAKRVMDKLIAYGTSWGNLYGVEFRPMGIIIPSKDSSGHTADVTWTSNTNSVVEQILGGGIVTDYFGYKFPIIPDVTLSYTAAKAYVKFGAVGEMYDKPGLAQSYDIVTDESRANNKGKMQQSAVVGFCAPKPLNPFVVEVTYATGR